MLSKINLLTLLSKHEMKISKLKKQNSVTFILFLFVAAFSLSSCGYKIIGSHLLPFDSISIKPVKNKTYEPRLEERLFNALSNEFISQGIKVVASGGRAELEATITRFALAAVSSVDEIVKEQTVIMDVDVSIVSNGEVIEFKSMKSPIYITFEATESISGSVANKEKVTDKASREIAKEIVSKLIIRYVK